MFVIVLRGGRHGFKSLGLEYREDYWVYMHIPWEKLEYMEGYKSRSIGKATIAEYREGYDKGRYDDKGNLNV